jgi:hypothetical protein
MRFEFADKGVYNGGDINQLNDISAGRFGTRGIAITFVAQKEETEILNQVQERFDVGIEPLPEWDKIDKSTYTNA